MFDFYNNVKMVTVKEVSLCTKRINKPTLSVTYTVERNDGAIDEIELLNMELNLGYGMLPSIEIEHNGFGCDDIFVNYDFGQLKIKPCNDRITDVFKVTNIKPADPKEMTMTEIEEKLGFPVKIVKEK